MSDSEPHEIEPRPESQPTSPAPEGGLPMYVADLASIEQQVGANLIQALQHEGAMGVLTIVRAGPGGQRIVSVPLDEEQLSHVNSALVEATEKARVASVEDQEGVPCVGFHCYLPHRKAAPPKE